MGLFDAPMLCTRCLNVGQPRSKSAGGMGCLLGVIFVLTLVAGIVFWPIWIVTALCAIAGGTARSWKECPSCRAQELIPPASPRALELLAARQPPPLPFPPPPPPDGATSSRFCRNCGASNPGKFCGACGAPS